MFSRYCYVNYLMYQVNKGDWPNGRYTKTETHNLMGSWLKVEY